MSGGATCGLKTWCGPREEVAAVALAWGGGAGKVLPWLLMAVQL
jgi:hypothetical protein